MAYDKQLVAGKLRRWEKYLNRFRLPQWDDIPDFGLYMEQVIVLLKKYLDYLPPELKEEQIITAAAINNYVRTKVMPGPNKKKYYRIHIAYLIIICSLKQNLSLAMLQKIIPMGINEDEVKEIYESFAKRHNLAAQYFVEQVRLAAASILDHDEKSELDAKDPNEMITFANANTAVTEMPITIAGSNFAVTASAEQMPSTCTITGLFFENGLKNTVLSFLLNIRLYFLSFCKFLKNT